VPNVPVLPLNAWHKSETSLQSITVSGGIVMERYRMMRFENRAPTRILGPKGEGGTGGWRRQHREELHNLYPSPYVIRVTK